MPPPNPGSFSAGSPLGAVVPASDLTFLVSSREI